MSRKEILKGTAILTITGILTRFMGFYYRIYLSRTFGEEGVGIYQLVFPVFSFCIAASSAGIETALSRAIARRHSGRKASECQTLFWIALFLSVGASLILLFVIQNYADFIAVNILKEERCENMLLIIAYAVPLSAIHSCVSGYYFGLKDTRIPAVSQFIEQIIRIGSVFIITMVSAAQTGKVSILYAVYGLVLGELASSLFSFQFLWNRFSLNRKIDKSLHSVKTCLSEILRLAVPLTANRMLLTALQSLESISIPAQLQNYGHSTETALSIYGVLTGMALPCIFFPTAITNAAAVMLLPTVAELQAASASKKLKELFQSVIVICVSLGTVFCIFFLLGSSYIGNTFFKSPLASSFILNLAFICPFLYANSTMISMINGMGKASVTFAVNIVGILIRIFCIKYFMHIYGIRSYLIGLLISHIVIFILAFSTLRHLLHSEFSARE